MKRSEGVNGSIDNAGFLDTKENSPVGFEGFVVQTRDLQNDSHVLTPDDCDDNVYQQIVWHLQAGMADFKRCGSKPRNR